MGRCAILALDGFWRHGGDPARILPMLEEKLQKNIARKWPASTSEDHAIEQYARAPLPTRRECEARGQLRLRTSSASGSLSVMELCYGIAQAVLPVMDDAIAPLEDAARHE